MHIKRTDDGFTLIELLISIVIIGIIAIPLGDAAIGILKNADATSGRLAESHDAQISSSYWAQDVASVGTRDNTDPLNPQLKQSIETGVSNSGGLYPCGTSGTATVRFASDNVVAGSPPTSTVTVVSYFVVAVGTRFELHRIRCLGSATPVSALVVAHDLLAAPTVACDVTCTGSGSSVPKTVTLTMSIQDPKNSTGSYNITLRGQRRQT
jgi:prepilin-type N-terminal cleavage/methylation domain-containing protein